MLGFGHFLIKRENLSQAISVMDSVADLAKQTKKNIGVAPEGTRRRKASQDNGQHILPFKKGPFHLAKRAEANIIPVTYQGVNRLTSPGCWRPGNFLMMTQELLS